MLGRLLAVAAVVTGLLLAVLGLALVLNVLSLRALAESTRLDPAIWAVFEVRDEMSHRRAQWLELLCGLLGMGMVGLGAWWLWSLKTHAASAARGRLRARR